ncbi:MAG: hypothetical protein IH786_09920 [Proteobacteria bacterium]|nr:hypothetical protein [Pseudomonadota bacterium]
MQNDTGRCRFGTHNAAVHAEHRQDFHGHSGPKWHTMSGACGHIELPDSPTVADVQVNAIPAHPESGPTTADIREWEDRPFCTIGQPNQEQRFGRREEGCALEWQVPADIDLISGGASHRTVREAREGCQRAHTSVAAHGFDSRDHSTVVPG